MSVLALVPAKGGSVRFRRKNIQRLGGRTLLDWAAQAARDSGVVDHLVCSTEDAEVADYARAAGMDVPFVRPEALAREPYGCSDVGVHAVRALRELGYVFDTLIFLLPTCPLRSGEDVAGAYRIFLERGRENVMSVAAFEQTPWGAQRILEDGRVEAAFPVQYSQRSQDRPALVRPNGAVHVVDVERFLLSGSYTAQPLFPYAMPAERSVDIDHAVDLIVAEALLQQRGAGAP